MKSYALNTNGTLLIFPSEQDREDYLPAYLKWEAPRRVAREEGAAMEARAATIRVYLWPDPPGRWNVRVLKLRKSVKQLTKEGK